MHTLAFNETLWSAIAEPSRRKLIHILLANGSATASNLATYLPISRQAVSKHMLILQGAGVVIAKKSGKELRFSVQPAGLASASKELSRAAQQWNARLQVIKQLAETL